MKSKCRESSSSKTIFSRFNIFFATKMLSVQFFGLCLAVFAVSSHAAETAPRTKSFMKVNALPGADNKIEGNSQHFELRNWFELEDYKWSVSRAGNVPVYALQLIVSHAAGLAKLKEIAVTNKPLVEILIETRPWGEGIRAAFVALDCDDPRILSFTTSATSLTTEFNIRCYLLNWTERHMAVTGEFTPAHEGKSSLNSMQHAAWARDKGM